MTITGPIFSEAEKVRCLCGHRYYQHRPAGNDCWSCDDCDEFCADVAPVPVCTEPMGGDAECGAPLVDRWMETVTCARGHVTRAIEVVA